MVELGPQPALLRMAADCAAELGDTIDVLANAAARSLLAAGVDGNAGAGVVPRPRAELVRRLSRPKPP